MPTIVRPLVPLGVSDQAITTLVSLNALTTEYLEEFGLAKVVSDPKETLVPETVPTIALALAPSVLSRKTITNFVSDKRVAILTAFKLVWPPANVTVLPKLIDVPETVPTTA